MKGGSAMTNAVDLWGIEIETSAARLPVTILREQASLLAKKTKGLVLADVSTMTILAELVHRFDLVVPGLDHYRYELFSIAHGVKGYPVRFVGARIPFSERAAKNEEEFIDKLSAILSSEETKTILETLIAQVQV
jgi:hypothetical protein